MQLTTNLEEEIALLEKYGLTADELLFIRCVLILQDDNNEELFKSLFKVLKQQKVNLKDLLVSLQEKSIILQSYKIPAVGQVFDPHSVQINKNFIKNLYKSSFELGKELFENYPQFGLINNNQVPLRGVSRFFNSLEDSYFRYGRCISWNPEKHKEIIELVKWGKENNLINKSLGAFIVDNSWNDLAAMKDGEVGNYNYSTIREL